MRKFKFFVYLFMLLLLPFAFLYDVKADEVLIVDKIEQIENSYNVGFSVISSNEVSVKYEDLGDTLEFEVTIKNKSSDYNAIIKNLTIINSNEGVDYTAEMDEENLEVKTGESRKIKVKGILNAKASDDEEVVKLQLVYTITKKPCTDCNKELPVVVNPKTGDNIKPAFIIAGVSILAIILIIVLLFIFKKKSKKIMELLLVLSLNILLAPLYIVNADSEYMIEILINQTIKINKIDDQIRVTPIEKDYTGEEVEPEFEDDSNTPIHPTYYDDDTCQNPIDGKPSDAGEYYATATSDGNDWYNEGVLECTKVVIINKVPSSCPVINDNEVTYDGKSHKLKITGEPAGGELYFSLNDIDWTKELSEIINAGEYDIKVKVVGDKNHSDNVCGTNTLTINPKQIIVKATDDTKEYDGTPLIASDTCKFKDSNIKYNLACVSDGASITNVGTKETGLNEVTIRDENGENITGNFDIKKETGTLTITKKQLTCPNIESTTVEYDGNPHTLNVLETVNGGVLEYSLDKTTWDTTPISVTNASDNKIYIRVKPDDNHIGLECDPKNINIAKKPIIVKATDDTKEYDGTPLIASDTCEFVREVSNSYSLVCSENKGSITEVGTAVKELNKVTIKDENGENITGNFEITKENGILRITAGDSICPTIKNVETTYDGESHSLKVIGSAVGGELKFSDDGTTWKNSISKTKAGEYTIYVKVSGDDNHSDVSCGEEHKIIINKKTVTIEAIDETKEFDGTALNASNTCKFEDKEIGYSLTCETDGSVTYVVDSPVNKNITSAVIMKDGKNISDNLNIEFKPGTLTITKKTVEVKASNQEKVYDGDPLTADDTCEFNGTYDGYTVSCSENTGSITNVGTVDKNLGNVVITNGTDNINENLNIVPKPGTLKVKINKTAEVGDCTNVTYNGASQELVSGGSHVLYVDNLGTDVKEYVVTVNTVDNYSFSDGKTTKTITCPINKASLKITPGDQDIKYGTTISQDLTNVSVEGLLLDNSLTSVTLTAETTDVTENGKINSSNAAVYYNGVEVTSNYDIKYGKGNLKIYYESTFVDGEHSETTSDPKVVKSYNNQLILNPITASNGYTAHGWLVDGEKVGEAGETITINGNKTYVSNCTDDQFDSLDDLSVNTSVNSFTLTLGAQDFGSGTTKVEWFYKKCGDTDYSALSSETITATNEKVVRQLSSDDALSEMCLTYGTYYAYAIVTDAAGNSKTSNEIEFDLKVPTTSNVNINSSNVGTTCNSLECSVNELLQYFK